MSFLHYYVTSTESKDGNGSKESPFGTLAQAQAAVRAADRSAWDGITVTLLRGTYYLSGLTFGAEDSGSAACPITWEAEEERESVLDGGVSLSAADFVPIDAEADAEVWERFRQDVREKIVRCDLTRYGLTAAEVSPMYARGAFNPYYLEDLAETRKQGIGFAALEKAPIHCELFCNGKRMDVARYPDAGGRMAIGQLDRERIGKWKTLKNAWIYIKEDWYETAEMMEKFGYKGNGFCYIYNVPEELDTPGEYWISDTTGVLYFLPPCDLSDATLALSVTENNMIECSASYVNFCGFRIENTRGCGVVLSGNDCTVSACLIRNVGDFGARISGGWRNKVSRCEITATGRGGVLLNGGDRETLTPGENVAEGNTIHDWPAIYPAYQMGVTLFGCGNICRYNEFYNSDHSAIAFAGNDHIMEYNDIHDVCKKTCDAGAIYSGRRYDWRGNHIRYNFLRNIRACGIYTDDELSGVWIYGNLLDRVAGNGLFLGGGRELQVYNNIVVRTGNPLSYDDRISCGMYRGGWCGTAGPDNMWNNLLKSPWQTEIWKKAYPELQYYHCDKENGRDDPNFCAYPAGSNVVGNLIVARALGRVDEDCLRFSRVENNPVHPESELNDIFEDADHGNYRVKPGCDIFELYPEFRQLPTLEEVGPRGLQ